MSAYKYKAGRKLVFAWDFRYSYPLEKGYQQNAPPLRNTIAYNFFVNKWNPTKFCWILIIKFCWILVIKTKVINNCIFERWCVLLVTRIDIIKSGRSNVMIDRSIETSNVHNQLINHIDYIYMLFMDTTSWKYKETRKWSPFFMFHGLNDDY